MNSSFYHFITTFLTLVCLIIAQKLSSINNAGVLSSCTASLEASHYLKQAIHNCQFAPKLLKSYTYLILPLSQRSSMETLLDIFLNYYTFYLIPPYSTISNQFYNQGLSSFQKLTLLFSLKSVNNRFAGKFPRVFHNFPRHKYLGLQFNKFEGEYASLFFDKDLDYHFYEP